MFNNPYHMEQNGRMHQQELLQAQQAEELAYEALRGNRPVQQRTYSHSLVSRIRNVFAHAFGLRRPAVAWLTRLFLLSVLAAVAVEPAAAANHGGDSAGSRSSAVSTGDNTGRATSVIDPASDISMFAADDGASAGSRSFNTDAGSPGGRSAKTDPASDNSHNPKTDPASDATTSGADSSQGAGGPASATTLSDVSDWLISNWLTATALILATLLGMLLAHRNPRAAA